MFDPSHNREFSLILTKCVQKFQKNCRNAEFGIKKMLIILIILTNLKQEKLGLVSLQRVRNKMCLSFYLLYVNIWF